MTTAVAAKRETPATAGCGGDGCESRDPWPLHHVRHRSVFCRLCTSCVLRYHPGAFCSSCFDVLDSPPSPDGALVYCSRCPALSHLSCVPDPQAASQYLCPTCSNPHSFSYFPFDGSGEAPAKKSGTSDGEDRQVTSSRRMIDLPSAKALLAAAKLAAASMGRAAVAARVDAERKVKEAAMAGKRAREMLEIALSVFEKEKDKRKESIEMAVAPPAEVVEPKKKIPKIPRKVQDRQSEKSMTSHEPIQMVHRPPVHGIVENDTNKGPSVNGVKSHVITAEKDRLWSLPHPPNNVAQEEREKPTKVLLLSSQSPGFEEEERSLTVEADKGPRIPQLAQDVSVPRSNTQAIFTGSSNTASLHS